MYISHENSIVCKGTVEYITGQVTRAIDSDTVVINYMRWRFSLASDLELTEKDEIEAKKFIKSLCPVGSKARVDEDDIHRWKIWKNCRRTLLW